MFKLLACLLFVSSSLFGGDVPPEMMARFIKIIAISAKTNTIACKDSDVANILKAQGLSIGDSSIVFTRSEADIKPKKLIICNSLDLLPKGGSIAIVVESNGKPAIYLHLQNIAASGVVLDDQILKVGRPFGK